MFPEVLDIAPTGGWDVHLFCDEDGALVGSGGWRARSTGRPSWGDAVAPARWRRGVAAAVIRALVERAAAAGLRTVVAHTLAEPSASTTGLLRCVDRGGRARRP